MKIITILGTRPEIIRLSRIIPKLDKICNHILIHTGQNYDKTLSDIFFKQLALRRPDYLLNSNSRTDFEQIGKILLNTEKILQKEKPDKVLILGDTNSALSALVAKRFGIPVYHMEAGNRCFDDKVPEEVNRRVIDHSSDILLPYTHRSRENLLKEGIPGNRIFVTGNPIYEVLEYFFEHIEKSTVLTDLSVKKNEYFLATMHRAENVDNEKRLLKFLKAFNEISKTYSLPIIWSVHPRTAKLLKQHSLISKNKKVIMVNPLGLFDFVCLEKNAFCVLTDSGTVQEECCIFKIPTVTLRDTTERPETIETGSNILSGAEVGSILRCITIVTGKTIDWNVPREYLEKNVSDTAINILLGYNATHENFKRR